ncbi:MAG: Fic family protein [Spirochaetaceae bacterium]|nr:Fic family protein [Spirochaetaceae bacterium]
MAEKNPFEIDFEEYIRHIDSSKKEKTFAWSTAIGLQQVDGLKPSSYLYETAKRNIEGELSFDDAKNLIDSYYESRTVRTDDEDERTEEADKVSTRIAQILSEPSFNFSPSHLIAIHKRLFEGIFKFAGKIRDYDITKKEWALNGDTVMYGASFELKSALDYDFEQERAFNYKGLSNDQIVKHITFFVSRLWQIHAFGEGNTRTTAVFTIKYLRSLGYKADNDIFAENSWYFRNALVRANYSNLQNGIQENSEFLELFFRNLILGENNELKNRYTHIDYDSFARKFGDNSEISEKKFGDNEKSSEKTSEIILSMLKENPKLSAKKLSEKIGITSRAVEKQLTNLVQKGLIKRIGSPKGGHWEILI